MSLLFQLPILGETLLVSDETSPRELDIFPSMAISAFNSATPAASLALAIATDEARLRRELARLESFEALESLEAVNAFAGSGVPA